MADNLPPQLDDAPELDADEKADVAEHCVRASKKFDQFDTDESGFLEGPELFEVASWVWGSFHPGGEPLSEELVMFHLLLLPHHAEHVPCRWPWRLTRSADEWMRTKMAACRSMNFPPTSNVRAASCV